VGASPIRLTQSFQPEAIRTVVGFGAINAIKTRKHSDDQTGKLHHVARNRLHGVLFQGACLDNTI
jgi:hypothetical protein